MVSHSKELDIYIFIGVTFLYLRWNLKPQTKSELGFYFTKMHSPRFGEVMRTIFNKMKKKKKMHRFDQCQSTERQSRGLQEALPAGIVLGTNETYFMGSFTVPPFR